MIKLLFIDEPLEPPGGGQFSLLTFLKFIDRRKYQIKVFLSRSGSFEKMLRDLDIDVNIVSLSGLSFKIFDYSPHIIHINSAATKYSFFSSVFGKFLLKKVVWHNRVVESSPLRERVISYFVDRIIVPSVDVEKKFFYSSDKIIKLPNPIDFSFLKNVSSENLKAELKMPHNAKVIGVFSRFDYGKGHQILFEAFSKLNYDNIFLLVCGTGQLDMDLKDLASKLGISKRVIFYGFVKNVYDYMKICDVVVNPSIEPESFGRVIIEAMALGKIVISTNLGGPKEIIDNEKDGFLIEPNYQSLLDILKRILEGYYDEEKIKENARIKAAQYDVSNYLQRIYKIYNEL